MCNEAQNGHFFVCVNFMVQCKQRILASNKFYMQNKVVLRETITQLGWLHQLHWGNTVYEAVAMTTKLAETGFLITQGTQR